MKKDKKETVVMPSFGSKEELKKFISMHIPIAIRPTKPAKTTFVNPYSSKNAMDVIIESLTDAFFDGA